MSQPDFWIRVTDTAPRLEVKFIKGTATKDLTGKIVRFTIKKLAL